MNWRREGDRIFIRLQRGDDVLGSLAAIADENGIFGGWLNGIGAARDVELGYYDVERREYARTEIDGDVEVASASGSIGRVDGAPFIDLHAVVTDRNCVPRAGHLFRATTTATLEFVLIVADAPIARTFDEDTGLKLWRV